LTSTYLYIAQDFPLLFIFIFLTIPQHQVLATQISQTAVIGSESSQITGASSHASSAETQQQHRHQFVHHNTAIAATENMTHNTHVKMVSYNGHRKMNKQHAIRCELLQIQQDGP